MQMLENVEEWDRRVHYSFENLRFDQADSFFSALTGLGSTYFSLALLSGILVVEESFFWGIAPGFGLMWTVVFGMKYVFDRPKPKDSPLAVDITPSFPSGHSATSVFLALKLSGLLPELTPLFLFLAATVAISRVYLGAHYPTDVLAGITIGAVLALAT
jgi:undecaprenyl-diphosphatase